MSLEKEKEKADSAYRACVQDHQAFQQKFEQEMKRFLAVSIHLDHSYTISNSNS
jgi:hypothetical protein